MTWFPEYGTIPPQPKPCMHPSHNPPQHMVFPPEGYLHRCPGCGKETLCRGSRVTC